MDLPSLVSLAKLGCCENSAEISSSKLAQELGVSQQTASRRIQKLEREGYVSREIYSRGQRVRLTAKGIDALRRLQQDLDEIFSSYESHAYYITGEISSGLGEGRYYMEIPGYMEQFHSKLGFKPYPGTLNLKLKTDEDVRIRQQLQEYRGIGINGFSHDNRTFGSVKCFKASIKEISGAIIIPSRSHYSFDSLELIAPVKVRSTKSLKDGDVVTVKVEVE